MNALQKHIQHVEQVASKWLSPSNMRLKKAILQSVEKGLFSLEDIKFQIRVLKQNVESGQIKEWVSRAGLSELSEGKKLLCLHAGNLPLVGFQDALGGLITGADYYGKLSRKDPYLLASFLEEAKEAGLKNQIHYSTKLDDFRNLQADKLMFAGSGDSVGPVKEAVNTLNAVIPEAEWVIRRAKFSMAYIDNEDKATMEDLVEAVLRYGGQGCRSVAVVVSPIRFCKLKCHLQDYIEAFWLKNPQHRKPNPVLAYQFAYNKAIQREQAWLEDFLIQESEEFPELDFTLHWVEGDHDKVRELRDRFGEALQTVYTTGEKIEGIETEFLSQAQRPPLWWKPDGIEVLG